MDELTFLLILGGIGIILLVAMFTYYKHHKKIRDEINDFNNHSHDIDDVLLQNDKPAETPAQNNMIRDRDLPGSFSASKNDSFDIDDISLNNDHFSAPSSPQAHNTPTVEINSVETVSAVKPSAADNSINDESGLVDGVYVNSRRVIQSSGAPEHVAKIYKPQTSHFTDPSASQSSNNTSPAVAAAKVNVLKDDNVPQDNSIPQADNAPQQLQTAKQNIKVVYDVLPENVEELIISHTILSKGEHFNGQQLFSALHKAGLVFGEMNIFHYPGDDKADTFALFSLANIVEPGTFCLEDAVKFSTPGVSLFMRLPSRVDNNEAYDKFVRIAKTIADDINGELCDETRSQLTQQVITYKKEQIKKLDFDIMKAEKLAH